jgi:hypothetical protein
MLNQRGATALTHTLTWRQATAVILFLFVGRLDIFCLRNPVQVPLQILLELLLLAELLEKSSGARLFALLGEFTKSFR